MLLSHNQIINLKKDIDVLHTEQGHSSEEITKATGKAMGLQVMGTLNPCKDCALIKAIKNCNRKLAATCCTIGE